MARQRIVYLNKKLTQNRKRFSLAHELGHILIPWHWGTTVSHDSDDGSTDADSRQYSALEREANRFAAELLMPTAWLRSQADQIADIAPAFEHLHRTAGVSAESCCISLPKALAPGFAFAILDDADVVLRSRRSDNTLLRVAQTALPGDRRLIVWRGTGPRRDPSSEGPHCTCTV